MKLNETNNEQSAQPKPQIRWGRVNHNYKALRIAAAGALSWEHKVNKAYFVKVYENKKPACLLLITDGSIGDRERFYEKLAGTYCDVPLHLVAYEGLKTALAKTGLQPFYIKSGYGCRTLSVPLDKGQIFFLTEYRDNAGLLQYSLDFEMACDTHIGTAAKAAEQSGNLLCRAADRLLRQITANKRRHAGQCERPCARYLSHAGQARCDL